MCSPALRAHHPPPEGMWEGTTMGTAGLRLYSHGFLELDLMQLVRETLLFSQVYSHIFYSKKFFLLITTSWLSSFYLLNYMGAILYMKCWSRLEDG